MENRSRTFQELADVQHLMHQPEIDREKVREAFAKRGLEDRYREIEATL